MFKIKLQKVFVSEKQKHYIFIEAFANGGVYTGFRICREHIQNEIDQLVDEYQWSRGYDKTPAIEFVVGHIAGIKSINDAFYYACKFQAIIIDKIDAYASSKVAKLIA